MKLDVRLQTIADLVSHCNVIADVGTDHGYLPVYLIINGKAKRAYATDVASSPLNKAKENIIKNHLENVIETILTDGLNEIPPDVDIVLIAGMGGHLIASILEKNQQKFSHFILQANSHLDVLRQTIVRLNYKIINEKICFCKGKFYEIIEIVNGHEILNDLQIKYGPILLKNKSPEFKKNLLVKHEKLSQVFTKLEKNSKAYVHMQKELKEIEIILKEDSN